ncbi:Heat shock 70kD protein binding protein [Spironucleus salmonicida]|uniref:Heat shock 70kD protein binding protein n=1 Tax=Spironucleus salmonicida TaxID=348837 RepID=V6LMA5_9EUKA|nr:Heat shock 70kD protein binding protein [Spironucleus salmonicida]|eukprot:EST45765.1 Heat shock 70kD protein binding protein [Spironucleus salmonicida]
MSDSDSMPELEDLAGLPDTPVLDRRQLPIGDPSKTFDEALLNSALEMRQQALQMQDVDQALVKISTAIEMFPASAIFLNTRAQLFLQDGDFQLALRDCALSIERAGPSFKSLKLMGKCNDILMEYGQAIACFKQALQLENDEEITEIIKIIYGKIKRQDDKQRAFEEAYAEKKQATEEAERTREKSNQEKMNEEVKRNYGDNPVYQTPLFQNLFKAANNMDDKQAEKLSQNQILQQALSDPEFELKLQEVARDPSAAAKYSSDKGFMAAFSQILGQFK